MKNNAWILGCVIFLVGSCLTMAQDSADALAAESEAYCASTAKEEPTAPETIVTMVDKACALLEKEGEAAFPKFQGEGSEFIFDGTYMWIHTLTDAKMLMHPIKHKMVGNLYTGLKDKTGKRFFVIMNQICEADGSGWVEYLWPKPGSTDLIRKISYVKTCTMPDGTAVVVGCGLYNYDDADLDSLNIQ